MDCSVTHQHLMDYLENKTPQVLHQQISDHLRHCQACQADAAKIQEYLDVLPQMKSTNPNPFLFTRIEQALQQETAPVPAPIPRFVRVFNTLVVGLLLVSTAVAGLYLLSNPQSNMEETPKETSIAYIADEYQLDLNNQDLMESYYLTQE